MGCRTQFCIGGSCVPTTTDVEAWVEAFGYTYNATDPLASTYKDLIAQAPAAFRSGGLYAAWPALAEACMRTRAILFCNQSPGDAGSTQATSSTSGLLAGAQEANSQLDPVPGVSQVLGEILQVFQAHAQAVTRQANALSSLTPQITEAIRRADASIAARTSTIEQAVAFLQQTVQSAKASWASLAKTCNAFCWYNAILDLMVNVSEYYWQLAVTQESLAQSDETNIIPTAANIPSNGVTTVASAPSTAASLLNDNVGGIKVSTIAIFGLGLIGVVALMSTRSNRQ